MRVLITGIDGYLGWPLANYLAARGHEIAGVDNFSRRKWVAEMGSHSVVPIANMTQREEAFRAVHEKILKFYRMDLRDNMGVRLICKEFQPDAIVHLGEQSSAAFSMIDVAHAVETQMNNIHSTLNLLYAMRDECPNAHLVKLGSMGEYGTPDCPIPEGKFPPGSRWQLEPTHNLEGYLDGMMFPRSPGSWYHASKVHDTHNVEMACRLWGLRSTDVMQGVVYGTWGTFGKYTATRFDVDEAFGTVINRFVAQAVIDEPLTVYGVGGQTRGFLPLRDSRECLSLALENPPELGEYRTFNQFAKTYSVTEIARTVVEACATIGVDVTLNTIKNPRVEQESHGYKPDHDQLAQLGYEPTSDLPSDIVAMFNALRPYRDRIEQVKLVLLPRISWRS